MELAANDRLIVKNILVQQVGFLGDASERAKDNTELLTLTAEMLDALKMIVLFDGSQEKDRRAGLSEEDDCTKKPALTTDEGQRQLMEAKRMLEREIATGSLKGLYLAQRIYSSLSSVLKCRASALSAMPERCSPVRRCSAIPKRMPRAGLRL